MNDSNSHEDVSLEQNDRGISTFAAIMVMANSVIGMGILTFPYAFSKAGNLYLAVGIEVVLTSLVIGASMMMGYAVHVFGHSTLQGLLRRLFGTAAGWICHVHIFINNFGACVFLLVILCEQIGKVLELIFEDEKARPWYLDKRLLLAVASTIFILPLCIPKSLSILKYTSFLGVAVTLYLSIGVCLVSYIFKAKEGTAVNQIEVPSTNMDMLKMLPIICFAYESHIEIPPVKMTLKNPSFCNFAGVVVGYTTIAFIIYTIVGIFGFLTFGANVSGDVLLDYSKHSVLIQIAMGLLTINIMSKYPITFYCIRATVIEVCISAEYALQRRKNPTKVYLSAGSDGSERTTDLARREQSEISPLIESAVRSTTRRYCVSKDRLRHLVVTLGIFLASVLLAALAPEITKVINMLGGLSALSIFFYPGMCFLRTFLWRNDLAGLSFQTLSVISILFGGFLFGCSTVIAFETSIF